MNDPRTIASSPTSVVAGDSRGLSNTGPSAAAERAERPIGRRQSDRIVVASESGQRSVDEATSCARGVAPVVIVGAGGTGKRHIGRAIHSWSSRAGGPLVVLSVRREDESQHHRDLFGSVGSMASLAEDPEGALSRAAQGSLLIAGIDCLEHSARQALIQALQAGTFQRNGQSDSIPASARIIATSQSHGESWLGDIPCQTVRLDGLDKRPEDVLPLCMHFLAEFSGEEGVRPVGLTTDARHWLVEEVWPGNVRELRERIRQAVRLNVDGAVSAEALMLATDGDEVLSFKQAKRAFETRYVEGLLRRCGGNISRAARLAKKDRKDFYDVIRRTGVDPGQFRS